MMAIAYGNMVEQLVEAVPELKSAYDAEVKWLGGGRIPAPHIFYGDQLNPCLISLLETEEQEVLSRIFTFLETLAKHEDVLVREVVAVTVLEGLWCEKDLWAKAQELMGKDTLRIAQAVEIHCRDGTLLQSI